ncbi:hypothetical protein JHK85_032467 [Glycine max]|nr:hypothetical protein JHK85_032467 [Glycine max]
MGGDDHTKTDLQAKPKQQVQLLEELYQGIPDESVKLTFQDLANVNSSNNTMATNERVSDQGGIISNSTKVPSPSLSTVPSLDIKKGLGASNHNHHHHEKNYSHHHHHHQDFGHRGGGESPWGRFSHASGGVPSRAGEYSMSYDGMKSAPSLELTRDYDGHKDNTVVDIILFYDGCFQRTVVVRSTIQTRLSTAPS